MRFIFTIVKIRWQFWAHILHLSVFHLKIIQLIFPIHLEIVHHVYFSWGLNAVGAFLLIIFIKRRKSIIFSHQS